MTADVAGSGPIAVPFASMGAKMQLYTCGYEGLTATEFIALLNKSGVRVVVDVRERPQSRKKGFSKTAFSALLAEAGIQYRHVPALGCPKPIRDRYKNDGNWNTYTRGFEAYLSKQKDAINGLAALARSSTACLVCFEADYNYCHRTYVGRAAMKAGAPMLAHITPKTVTPDQQLRQAA